MVEFTPLVSAAALWSVAAISPGPNFWITIRTAVVHSRRASLRVVTGIVIGTLSWGIAGFLGIQSLFAIAPWLYLALKLIGGAYLILLGSRLIVGSFGTQTENPVNVKRSSIEGWSALRLGLITNLANPKAAIFVTSLFAATMPPHISLTEGLSTIALMVAISFSWYALVACLFSSQRVSALYRLIRHWIDRLAGAFFVGFGLDLVFEQQLS